MASNYSTNLKIELISTGEQAGTWGDTTNTNLGTALEEAIVGYGAVPTDGDGETVLNYSNTNNSQPARCFTLNVTGALAAAENIVVPTITKSYIVQNNTTGGYDIVVKTSGQTGGINVPQGKSMFVYVDGTNVVEAITHTPVSSGGTGSSTLAANNVLLGNGTSALQTVAPGTDGNFLVSDGTTWTTESGATARTSLGLSAMATQDPASVAITGGTISGLSSLSVDGDTTVTNGRISGNGALPAGAVMSFAMQTPPTGWKECNGDELAELDYPDLFAAIGTIYNTGTEASGNFRLPDLRGEFVRGWDNGKGTDSGRTFASSQGDAIRNITGSVATGHSLGLYGTSGTGAIRASGTLRGSVGSSGSASYYEGHDFDASRQVPTASENRPRNIAMMYCIKT